MGAEIKMVESKGKKNQVTHNGKTYDIFWYHDRKKFLFVNRTKKEECQVIFDFELDGEDPVHWDFKVGPGEHVLKEINPKGGFKIKCRFVVAPVSEEKGEIKMVESKG